MGEIPDFKPHLPSPSFPTTKDSRGPRGQRVPWRFSNEHGTLLGSLGEDLLDIAIYRVCMGRSLTACPTELSFRLGWPGWLVMGASGMSWRTDPVTLASTALLPRCEHLVLSRGLLCPQQTPAHLPGNPTAISSPGPTPEALPAEGQKREKRKRKILLHSLSLF